MIIDSHVEVNKEVVRKKWESIKYCYNDNVQGAINSLDEAYKEGIKEKVAEWILNDILIDKGNLEYLSNNINNVFNESQAQNTLKKNQNILYYPVLDRLAQEIYKIIIEEKTKAEMSTPYTSHVGTGIDKILESVSEYFIWAVYYGSYTHIKIVRRLLQDIFYNFYKIYNTNEWGFEALRYSILNENSKFIKDICDRNSNVIAVCSRDKIEALYYLSDKMDGKYSKIKLKINVFNYLGYYFSDDGYSNIENEIFNIFNEWLYSNNSSLFLGQDVFKSILSNVHRINKRKIVGFLIAVLNKKYYRFYDDVFKIITLIPNNEIDEEMIKEIIDIVINIVKDKEQKARYNKLEYCIIYLRKTRIEHSKIIDEIIDEYWDEIKESYILEVSENDNEYYNSIMKYLEEIKHRNVVQGNGVYYGYGYNPEDIIKQILMISNANILDDNLLQIITDTCKECLMKEKQTISEKISCIQLLIYLKNISVEQNLIFDWNTYYNLLEEEKLLQGYVDGLFDKDSNLTLSGNYVMYKIINGNGAVTELLELLSYYNDNNVYENIKILEAIKSFLHNSEKLEIKKEIYIILLQFVSRYISDKNYEVKYRTANCLFEFIGKFTDEVVHKYISIISNDLDYRVKLAILNNIDKQQKKSIFKYVIEKYSVDNNYLVRERAKAYDKYSF